MVIAISIVGILIVLLDFCFVGVNPGQAHSRKKKFGREICVFETSASSLQNEESNTGAKQFNFYAPYHLAKHSAYSFAFFRISVNISSLRLPNRIFLFVIYSLAEETDDLYEFTAEDCYRIMNTKKEGEFDRNRII